MYMWRVYEMKVTRLTLGDLYTCLRLVLLRGRAMGIQKSAEVILSAVAQQRRTEKTSSLQSDLSEIKVGAAILLKYRSFG